MVHPKRPRFYLSFPLKTPLFAPAPLRTPISIYSSHDSWDCLLRHPRGPIYLPCTPRAAPPFLLPGHLPVCVSCTPETSVYLSHDPEPFMCPLVPAGPLRWSACPGAILLSLHCRHLDKLSDSLHTLCVPSVPPFSFQGPESICVTSGLIKTTGLQRAFSHLHSPFRRTLVLLSVDSLVFVDTSLEVFCHLSLFKPLMCYLRCLIQFLMWCFLVWVVFFFFFVSTLT